MDAITGASMTRPDHTAVPPADVIAAAGPLTAAQLQPLLKFWFGLEDCKGLFNPERLLAFANAARAEGAPPTAAQAAGLSDPEPCGWLAGTGSDGGETMFYRREAAQRECDEHNAYERSRPDFDPEDLRAPEPVYRASHAPNATLAASRDAESATSGATSEELADFLNVTLWLYRRLPQAYGHPPFVDQAVLKMAKWLGKDAPLAIEERAKLHAKPE
jgi:hypothetical protein